MPISIRNPEVARLARQVAQMKGVTMTEALRQSLAAELEHEAARRDAMLAERRRGIDDIIAEFRNLPVLDDRTADEILGYDENGLPT